MTFTPDRSTSHHPTLPLTRAHMPTGFDISLKDYTDGGKVRFPSDFGPAQALEGFDPDYRNIIDYIVRITARIWETEAREVDYIGACYAPDCKVYDDYGLQPSNAKIIADTHHTTGAFSDIILDAEEVIWAGDDQKAFHTSHLCRIIGTNDGESRYGAATGRAISVLVIANCVAKGNDIFLEHVLYNTSAMLQQLGIDLWQEAERLAANPPAGWPRKAEIWNGLRRAAAPAAPLSQAEPVEGFDPDAFARALHDNVWNGDGAEIAKAHVQDMPFEGTTQRAFTGINPYHAYVGEIRACFPDLKLSVDEVYWMGNEAEGWLISTRWSAEGTHSSGTLYREPTGAACQIWGITQQKVKDGRVEQEWQLFNELDVMMQIAKARLDG
ncbi:MAG: ester cyclase [Pseudomonadota bacterium]